MSTSKTTGIDVRHQRGCRSRDGAPCNCRPTYQAHIFDKRTGKRIRRTFDTSSGAKLWRQDALVAVRQGTLRPSTSTTVQEAADALVAGMLDGSILNRSGRPYKPSSCRGYRQLLDTYALPTLGSLKLSSVRRRDVQDLVEDMRRQQLSPSTITNALDPLRVIFRRAIRRDEITTDPTDHLELPAVRGQRDRILSPEQAHAYLDALPESERAFWAVAFFAGLRRGELRGLRWEDVDFDAGLIRVERSWDPEDGEIDVKTTAGLRALPLTLPIRRELAAHKLRTGRDGTDLVFGRTAADPFIPSTVRNRALEAWGWRPVKRDEEIPERARTWRPVQGKTLYIARHEDALEPVGLHEARHCAISYFIASGMDWKRISTYAGHGDIRQTWNRYGHLVPGADAEATDQLSAYLDRPTVAHTVAHGS